MELKDILYGSGGAFLILITLVQISPIKINPWSWIAKQIGQALNKEVTDKIDTVSNNVDKIENQVSSLDAQVKCIDNQMKQLDTKVHDIDASLMKLDARVEASEKKTDENNVMICRARILRFGDEILHNQAHSKEHFDQILLDCTMYENYCTDHPGFRNNIAGATIKRIKNKYDECLDNNSFL